MRMLSIIQVTAGEKSDCAIAPSELRGDALRKTVLYRLELLSIQHDRAKDLLRKKRAVRAQCSFFLCINASKYSLNPRKCNGTSRTTVSFLIL